MFTGCGNELAGYTYTRPSNWLDLDLTMDASPKGRYQGEEKLVISIDLGTTMSPYTPHVRFSIHDLADPFRRCSGLHAFVPRLSTAG